MRLSADRDDPGYVEAARLGIDPRHILILCNGDPLRSVITADTQAGSVIVRSLDDRGLCPLVGDRAPEREIRGRVDILLLSRRDGSWPHPGVPNPAECEDAAPPRLRLPPAKA